MKGYFVEVCKRRGMIVNGDKSKGVVVWGVYKRLVCEFSVYGRQLGQISEFMYLTFVLDDSGTDGTERSKEMACGRKAVDGNRSHIKTQGVFVYDIRVLCL